MSNLEIFTNGVKALLNGHYPNDACVEEISSFLYRYIIDILKKSGNVDSEIESNSPVCQMEALTFQKNIRDILLYSSQNIMVNTLTETFNKVKYATPLTRAGDPVPSSISFGTKASTPKKVLYDPPAADFDMIDIESIPKVNTSAIKVDTTMTGGFGSNSFSGNFREVDLGDLPFTFGENKPKPSSQNNNTDRESFVTDASKFSGDYSKVPKMSIDLDY